MAAALLRERRGLPPPPDRPPQQKSEQTGISRGKAVAGGPGGAEPPGRSRAAAGWRRPYCGNAGAFHSRWIEPRSRGCVTRTSRGKARRGGSRGAEPPGAEAPPPNGGGASAGKWAGEARAGLEGGSGGKKAPRLPGGRRGAGRRLDFIGDGAALPWGGGKGARPGETARGSRGIQARGDYFLDLVLRRKSTYTANRMTAPLTMYCQSS